MIIYLPAGRQPPSKVNAEASGVPQERSSPAGEGNVRAFLACAKIFCDRVLAVRHPSPENLMATGFWRRMKNYMAARSAFRFASAETLNAAIVALTVTELEVSGYLRFAGGLRNPPGSALTWPGRTDELLRYRLAMYRLLPLIERLFGLEDADR